jgi:hypothetical protein
MTRKFGSVIFDWFSSTGVNGLKLFMGTIYAFGTIS